MESTVNLETASVLSLDSISAMINDCETSLMGVTLVTADASTTSKRKSRTKVEKTADEPMPLTAKEQKRYEQLKQQVRDQFAKGFAATVQIGHALIEIRDSKLYRDEYAAWEDYLIVEYGGLKQNYASRLMKTAKLDKCLEAAEVPTNLRPKTESQARELLCVPGDKLREVVTNAHALAGESGITAEHFRQAAAEYKPALSTTSTMKPSKAKIEVPKSSAARSLNLNYNEITGHLILAFGTEEKDTQMISLADLIRQAGIPERDMCDALFACFGTVGILDGPETIDEPITLTWEDDAKLAAA